jgi:hypothetical protein
VDSLSLFASRPWSVDGDRSQLIASLTDSTPFANTPYVSYIGEVGTSPAQPMWSDLSQTQCQRVVRAAIEGLSFTGTKEWIASKVIAH